MKTIKICGVPVSGIGTNSSIKYHISISINTVVIDRAVRLVFQGAAHFSSTTKHLVAQPGLQ